MCAKIVSIFTVRFADILMNYNFIKSFLTVSSWTFISRISGVVREMVLASVLGAGVFTDIYLFAIKIPNFFRRFFAEGALNAVLVPKFSSMIEHDTPDNVQKFANQLFSILAVWLLVFVAIFEVGMPTVISVIAPGFKTRPFITSNIVYYARLVFPYIWMISMVAFISGILNSLHRFACASGISVILNISIVSALVCGQIGKFSQVAIMHMLCLGIIIGGLLQFIIVLQNCKKHGMTFRLSMPRLTPDVKKILAATAPGMAGAGVVQINVFVDMAFASILPTGAVSYLGYADRLNQLPLSLIGAAIGTTLLPPLSRLWDSHKHDEARAAQNKALVIALMFAIPAAAGLFVTAEPIVHMLYGRGAFDLIAEHNTTAALKAFVCGLPGYVAVKIFSTIFFSNKDTRTPVIIAGISVLLNVVLNAVLIKPFGHVGIAIATAVSASINALLSGLVLSSRKLLSVQKTQWLQILGIILASVFMYVVVAGVVAHLNERSAICKTAFAVVTGLFTYVISVCALYRKYCVK
ncbi:MAG: murein biosynthesis integral membrane protein MurJ [Holosporales bacterium]|jgi:putative peptidoglycan lipid II flippase|nr:murein biosynthesis integral membrane protein MurJ [Holosporales bacterium]